MQKKIKPSLFTTYIKHVSAFTAEFTKFRKEVMRFNTKIHKRLDAVSVKKLQKKLKVH